MRPTYFSRLPDQSSLGSKATRLRDVFEADCIHPTPFLPLTTGLKISPWGLPADHWPYQAKYSAPLLGGGESQATRLQSLNKQIGKFMINERMRGGVDIESRLFCVWWVMVAVEVKLEMRWKCDQGGRAVAFLTREKRQDSKSNDVQAGSIVSCYTCIRTTLLT